MSYISKSIIALLMLSLVACSSMKNEVQLVGRFNHQDNEYTYIVLNEDGSCEFTFSYFGGVCEAMGSYSILDDELEITLVESSPDYREAVHFNSEPEDFIIKNSRDGYMSLEHNLTIVDKNTLQMNSTLYAAYEGSQFIRQNDLN